ncbi:hypothetical protein MQX03_01795 [Chryseobacterium aahli]|uniref:hypothetical protein n=1 Tax=Chryseobacterium aahli TaxID=1278643 RepID=UPI001F6199F2|nr:hypothetical protein [Chryseobacterium aahli]MCI3935911.1 hypothetical protein [Chryseobacterium aahli]
MNPDPSISIGIFIFVPLVIILNLIIAGILYFTKREFVTLFVVNSIIAGILMFYLFGKGIDRYQNERLESWTFKLHNTTYLITHWKPENTFDMSESNNTGSSKGFLDGEFITKGNEYYLKTDTTEYIIKNGYLYKFRKESDSIKLTKIER